MTDDDDDDDVFAHILFGRWLVRGVGFFTWVIVQGGDGCGGGTKAIVDSLVTRGEKKRKGTPTNTDGERNTSDAGAFS